MGVILPNPIGTEELDTEDKFLDLIEPGWYDVEIVSSEQKTSSSNYTYLGVIFKFITPDNYKDKLKYWFFGIYDGSEKSIAFNRALLGRLARACGVSYLEDTSQIEGKRVRILFSESDFNNQPQNRLKKFAPCEIKDTEDQPKQFQKKSNPPPAKVSDDDDIPF